MKAPYKPTIGSTPATKAKATATVLEAEATLEVLSTAAPTLQA
jgi:hypothetical protein